MQHSKKVKRVLLLILAANLLVAALKVIFGKMIMSTGMVADGVHSLADGMSNVAGLAGLYLAGRPVDENHPYGHRRYENITGLFIGGILLFFAAKIALEAVERLQHPVRPDISLESIAVLVFTLAVNILIASYEARKGRELKSDILIADSLHTKSDIFVTCGILLSLFAIYFGAPPQVDPVASLVVVLFILYAAGGIVKQTSEVLLDHAAVDVELVKSIALGFAEVVEVHAVRSRSSGQSIYVDMHIHIDPAMNVEQAHKLVHDIEKELKEKVSEELEVLIHTEPAR